MTKKLTLNLGIRTTAKTTNESGNLKDHGSAAYAGIKTSRPGFVKHAMGHAVLCLLFSMYFLNAHGQNINCAWAYNMGNGGNSGTHGTAVDGAGNVYVTGNYEGPVDFDPGPGTAILSAAGGIDVFLAKYDPNGNYLWAKSMGGSGYDEGLDVCVDREGNVYVTGKFASADFDAGPGTAVLQFAGVDDIFLAKYDSAGNYRWAFSIGSDGIDYGTAVDVDAAGNVYVTGYFGLMGAGADFDPGPDSAMLTTSGESGMFVARYDAGGHYIWAKAVYGGESVNGWGIAVDDMANVYVVGSFAGAADFDPGPGTVMLTAPGGRYGGNDAFITKYDTSGNFHWAIHMGDSDNDVAYGVDVDDAGNVYATGHFSGTVDFDPGAGTAILSAAGDYDVYLAKYDPNGNCLWAAGMGGSNTDYGTRLTIDYSNNVYVTGAFFGPADFYPGASIPTLTTAAGQNMFIAKYDSAGTHLWAKSIGGSINDRGNSSTDRGLGIAMDGGNAYVAGVFNSLDFDPGPNADTLVSAGGFDAFVMKLVCVDTSSSHITASIKCGTSYTLNGKSYGTAGIHKQYFPNAAGCDSTVFLELTVISIDAPVITVDNDVLGVAGTYVVYQWIKNGVDVPGATNPTYTATENADYQVRVIDGHNCEGISDIYGVTNISVDEYKGISQYISIYPNPVKEVIYINSPVSVDAHLSGIDARVVLHVEDAKTIPVQGLAKGMYLLHIRDQGGRLIKVEKIIKQ